MRKHCWKFLSLFGCLALFAGCAGEAPQISGIVAVANFETTACVPQSKSFQIRNPNSEEPQRVQGVMFELGTNDFDSKGNKPDTLLPGQNYFQYFKVEEVSVGNVVKAAAGNLVEEIILPPGGVMNVKVTYNPKAVTVGEAYHNTYLDVVLNGPKLGVMQVELRGKAPTAEEGCGQTQGDLKRFKVTKVKIQIEDSDQPNIPVQEITNITEAFQFGVEGNTARISKQDFPTIRIETPTAPVDADLTEDTFEGSFDGSKLEFATVKLSVMGVLEVEGKLTTESVDVSSEDGSLSATGAALADGKMKLVFGAVLPDNQVLQTLQGGVITAEIELEEDPS